MEMKKAIYFFLISQGFLYPLVRIGPYATIEQYLDIVRANDIAKVWRWSVHFLNSFLIKVR